MAYIVIGDDDQEQLVFMQEILEELGHEVSAAQYLNVMVALAANEKPDVVISDFDYKMFAGATYANGLEGLLAIRESSPDTRLILMSALHRPEATAAGIEQWDKARVLEFKSEMEKL